MFRKIWSWLSPTYDAPFIDKSVDPALGEVPFILDQEPPSDSATSLLPITVLYVTALVHEWYLEHVGYRCEIQARRNVLCYILGYARRHNAGTVRMNHSDILTLAAFMQKYKKRYMKSKGDSKTAAFSFDWLKNRWWKSYLDSKPVKESLFFAEAVKNQIAALPPDPPRWFVKWGVKLAKAFAFLAVLAVAILAVYFVVQGIIWFFKLVMEYKYHIVGTLVVFAVIGHLLGINEEKPNSQNISSAGIGSTDGTWDSTSPPPTPPDGFDEGKRFDSAPAFPPSYGNVKPVSTNVYYASKVGFIYRIGTETFITSKGDIAYGDSRSTVDTRGSYTQRVGDYMCDMGSGDVVSESAQTASGSNVFDGPESSSEARDFNFLDGFGDRGDGDSKSWAPWG